MNARLQDCKTPRHNLIIMKKIVLLPAILMSLFSCKQKSAYSTYLKETATQFIDSTEMTNNFYDNTETFQIPVRELTVEGEIANPGKVDFSKLPKHSVIVKETLLDTAGKDEFVGAYRYDGYSLFDILEKRILNKANAEEFSQIIDMYIEIENDRGEKVVFSWGEIYYPNNLHRILIADAVSRIVPSKTGELWELPAESKIVAGNDLISERNIGSPVKITVKSFPKTFEVRKGLSPMFSKQVRLFDHGNFAGSITGYPPDAREVTYNTIFYGRGKGIHSTEPFTGLMLKDILDGTFPFTRGALQQGIMCIAAQDGYRCSVSFSELFNRNDQQEFIIVRTNPDEDGGLFRIFPASDFFSDRAIKSVSEIHLGY
jgi:hypothetical protein